MIIRQNWNDKMYTKPRIRALPIILFVLTITLIALGCSTSTLKEGLHTTLELKGQAGKFTLINATSETQILGFSSGCQFNYTVQEIGGELYEWPLICTQATTSFTLAPLEKKEFKFSIKDRVNLKPGTYKLKAYVIGYDDLNNEIVFEVEE